MTDLLEIAPATAYDVVRISGGRRVKVRGLHGNDIAAIAARFPNLIALFAAAGDNVVSLISSFGTAIGPIIAAGCDRLGDEKQEAAAGRFLFEDQVKLVKAIYGLTFPNGLNSFMALMADITVTEPEKESRSARRHRNRNHRPHPKRISPGLCNEADAAADCGLSRFQRTAGRARSRRRFDGGRRWRAGRSKGARQDAQAIDRAMALKFLFTANVNEWREMMLAKHRPVATAGVAALRDVAAISVQEGREDIGQAGPGFRRAEWQSGLQYRTKGTKKDGEPSLDASATIYHRYGIAGVFEYGATIHGRPLMWIPTKHKGATASRFSGGKKGSRSKDLVSATIKGTPVLFDKKDKSRDRKPVFIGVPQVTIPDKFHVTEIVEKNTEKFAALFYLHFEDNI